MEVMQPVLQIARPEDNTNLLEPLERFIFWKRRILKIPIAFQKKVTPLTGYMQKSVQMEGMSGKLLNTDPTVRRFGKSTPLLTIT